MEPMGFLQNYPEVCPWSLKAKGRRRPSFSVCAARRGRGRPPAKALPTPIAGTAALTLPMPHWHSRPWEGPASPERRDRQAWERWHPGSRGEEAKAMNHTRVLNCEASASQSVNREVTPACRSVGNVCNTPPQKILVILTQKIRRLVQWVES